MNILIAIDSFKGSLSSSEAGNIVKDAAETVFGNAVINLFPIADGGEGTVKALSVLDGAVVKHAEVKGPLAEKVNAEYCILPDNTAVIEAASAAGLTLVPEEKRNPFNTTTYGIGELICDAILNRCRNFIVGIGGSATNDGGTGMLTALGYRFLNSRKNEIECCGKGLKDLCFIDFSNVLKELPGCSFTVACDVTNPLCGENGCSNVFARQKGATESQIHSMDLWLENFAQITSRTFPDANPDFSGSGAAGGLGFAFRTFLGGTLKSGIDTVLTALGIEEKIKQADLIITGEGKLDKQTLMGKAPIGVARMAKKYRKKVIAFAGTVSDSATILTEHGIDAYFQITPKELPLSQALNPKIARKNLFNTAVNVFSGMK